MTQKKVGELKMNNTKARAMLNKLELLIDISIVDEERKTKYLEAINFLRPSLVLLRQKNDFTNEQIQEFQKGVDKFFQIWVTLWG